MHCIATLSQETLSRKTSRFSVLAVAFFVTILALQPGYSEQNSASPDAAAAIEPGTAPVASNASFGPFSKIAIGVTFGLLGPGVEVATPLTRRTNLRVDGSFFQYSLSPSTFTENGVNYGGNLNLRDVRASYDFFPFHGSFRLSGGVEVYNRINVNATGTVDVGQTVTFNHQDYLVQSPLLGNASLIYGNKVAPTFSFGWGNAIPRSGRHFAFPVEIGAAYTGMPKFNLAMTSGSVCEAGTTVCGPVGTVDNFQANVTTQKNKIINDLNSARFYPILNAGVTYRF